MSAIRDLHGQVLEAGDVVILRDVRNYPAQILEISELAVPFPGKAPVRTATILIQVNMRIEEPADTIPVFLTKKGEPKGSLIES